MSPILGPTFRELSNVSSQSINFKTKEKGPEKRISVSSAALIDNKRTASIVRPALSNKTPSPRAVKSDREDGSSDQSSESSASSASGGRQSSTPEDTKAVGTLKKEDLTLPLGESGDKLTNTQVPAANKATIAASPLPGEIATEEATKETRNETEISKERTAAATTTTTTNSVTATAAEIAKTETESSKVDPCSDTPSEPSPEDIMPGSRRELLQNRLSMDDTTDHPHKTTVFIHEDNAVLRVLEDGTVKPEEEIIEDDDHSMFVSGRSSRRLSEPAVGSHFLRELQEKVLGERSLSRSIQTNLPSDLVAEEDEGEAESEDQTKASNEKQPLDISDLSISDVSPRQSSQSKRDTDATDIKLSSTPPSTKTVSVKAKGKNSKGKATGSEKERVDALKHRRRSDGDVLRFAKVFRMKDQRISSGKAAKDAEEKPLSEKDKVWEAVRRCRYIRGYDPPEMEIANNGDISEFVFGHRDHRSVAQNN